MLIHAVLAFALIETLVLGALLWVWSDRVAGARLARSLSGCALRRNASILAETQNNHTGRVADQ